MQDRFVGDIGDFCKYGLLRKIFSKLDSPVEDLKLGVIWCYHNTSHNNSRTFVCTPEEYKYLDEPLFNALRKLTQEDPSIAEVQRSKILPTQIYFDMPISGISKRERVDWITTAIEKTKEASVVFVDPDKGIATKKMTDEDSKKKSPLSKRSAEHVYIDELIRFVHAGKSLIIYQHLGQRNATAEENIENVSIRLKDELKRHIIAMRWHRIQGRAYFIVVHPDHTDKLCDKIRAFLDSPWGELRRGFKQAHFTLAYPPEGL